MPADEFREIITVTGVENVSKLSESWSTLDQDQKFCYPIPCFLDVLQLFKLVLKF